MHHNGKLLDNDSAASLLVFFSNSVIAINEWAFLSQGLVWVVMNRPLTIRRTDWSAQLIE